jgi:excisionase family DNA binding protein
MPNKINSNLPALRANTFVVEPNGVYDLEEAAKYFDVSTRTILRWLNKKLLRAAKPCGKIKFKGEWLLEFFENKDILIGKELEG